MNRDNHAGKLSDLSYVGGFFDGEGYIGLGKQQTTTNGGTNILPSVRLSNTDQRPLKHIKDILDSYGLKTWFSTRTRLRKRKDGSYAKDMSDVGFSGQAQVKRFIELVRPYVFSKGGQMDVVLEFINLRQEKQVGRGNRQGVGKIEYTPYEISLIEKVKVLKHTNPSETTRRDSVVKTE